MQHGYANVPSHRLNGRFPPSRGQEQTDCILPKSVVGPTRSKFMPAKLRASKRDPDSFSIASNKVGQSRSEEHTSELQSLMRTSYAVFCLKKKIRTNA